MFRKKYVPVSSTVANHYLICRSLVFGSRRCWCLKNVDFSSKRAYLHQRGLRQCGLSKPVSRYRAVKIAWRNWEISLITRNEQGEAASPNKAVTFIKASVGGVPRFSIPPGVSHSHSSDSMPQRQKPLQAHCFEHRNKPFD